MNILQKLKDREEHLRKALSIVGEVTRGESADRLYDFLFKYQQEQSQNIAFEVFEKICDEFKLRGSPPIIPNDLEIYKLARFFATIGYLEQFADMPRSFAIAIREPRSLEAN